MAKQTGKGRPSVNKGRGGRKEAAFERHAAGHAMHHNNFVGDADAERAGTEFLKADQKMMGEEQKVVQQMADSLAREAGLVEGAFHTPKSFKDGVEMVGKLRDPELREELREKARERLETMPGPVQVALKTGERMVGMLTAPVQRAVEFVASALRVPGALFQILRNREA